MVIDNCLLHGIQVGCCVGFAIGFTVCRLWIEWHK